MAAMRKRKRGRGSFNLSGTIRDYLTTHNAAPNSEVWEYVQRKANGPVNKNTFSVTISQARRQLGIGDRRIVGRRAATSCSLAATRGKADRQPSLVQLQAAKRFLEQLDDPTLAEQAVRLVQQLQL